MPILTDHRLPGLNEALNIEIVDEPGAGGACHHYSITGFDTADNPAKEDADGYASSFGKLPVIFQNGPVKEVGVNGISHEALLAILIHRLTCFQSGEFGCWENANALVKLEEALMWLQKRTRDRMARGVEGTSAK